MWPERELKLSSYQGTLCGSVFDPCFPFFHDFVQFKHLQLPKQEKVDNPLSNINILLRSPVDVSVQPSEQEGMISMEYNVCESLPEQVAARLSCIPLFLSLQEGIFEYQSQCPKMLTFRGCGDGGREQPLDSEWMKVAHWLATDSPTNVANKESHCKIPSSARLVCKSVTTVSEPRPVFSLRYRFQGNYQMLPVDLFRSQRNLFLLCFCLSPQHLVHRSDGLNLSVCCPFIFKVVNLAVCKKDHALGERCTESWTEFTESRTDQMDCKQYLLLWRYNNAYDSKGFKQKISLVLDFVFLYRPMRHDLVKIHLTSGHFLVGPRWPPFKLESESNNQHLNSDRTGPFSMDGCTLRNSTCQSKKSILFCPQSVGEKSYGDAKTNTHLQGTPVMRGLRMSITSFFDVTLCKSLSDRLSKYARFGVVNVASRRLEDNDCHCSLTIEECPRYARLNHSRHRVRSGVANWSRTEISCLEADDAHEAQDCTLSEGISILGQSDSTYKDADFEQFSGTVQNVKVKAALLQEEAVQDSRTHGSKSRMLVKIKEVARSIGDVIRTAGDIFVNVLKSKENAAVTMRLDLGAVKPNIEEKDNKSSLLPHRNIEQGADCGCESDRLFLAFPSELRGKCLETLRTMEITDTLPLINALNDMTETDELHHLQEVALFYIRWIQKHCAEDSIVAYADEYMLFGQLRARNHFISCLICQWFEGLCDEFRHSRKGETKIAELLRIALLLVDEKLFKAFPNLLVQLAGHLLEKVFEVTEFTQATYSHHIATFVTLEHTIFASFKFLDNQAKHELRTKNFRPFMKLLRRIIRDHSAYYPFRYECKMIIEDLFGLESGTVKSDALLESVRECFLCAKGIPDTVAEGERLQIFESAKENLQELFRDADIPSSWHGVISALHWVSLEVFHEPESYTLVEKAFDALDANATLKTNKEARMAVRFGVIVQLRILATQGPKSHIRTSCLDKLISLAEKAEQNGYGDDTEIFEALLDTLVRVYQSVQNKHKVQDAVARMANFKTTGLRKAFDVWLGSQTIWERINSSIKQGCQPEFQRKSLLAAFFKELECLERDQ